MHLQLVVLGHLPPVSFALLIRLLELQQPLPHGLVPPPQLLNDDFFICLRFSLSHLLKQQIQFLSLHLSKLLWLLLIRALIRWIIWLRFITGLGIQVEIYASLDIVGLAFGDQIIPLLGAGL